MRWLIDTFLFGWFISVTSRKILFAQHVVKLFTFKDLEVTITFHSTWFHTNSNYNNYWNNSSLHAWWTAQILQEFALNTAIFLEIKNVWYISAFWWIWKVQCFYLYFKPIFILYTNIQQVSFVGSCLSIAVISDLQLLYEDLARTEIIMISYLDLFILVLSNESS